MADEKTIVIDDITFTLNKISVRRMSKLLSLQKKITQIDISDEDGLVSIFTESAEVAIKGWDKADQAYSPDALVDELEMDDFMKIITHAIKSREVSAEKKDS